MLPLLGVYLMSSMRVVYVIWCAWRRRAEGGGGGVFHPQRGLTTPNLTPSRLRFYVMFSVALSLFPAPDPSRAGNAIAQVHERANARRTAGRVQRSHVVCALCGADAPGTVRRPSGREATRWRPAPRGRRGTSRAAASTPARFNMPKRIL